MKTLLRSTVITFLVGLILSTGYLAYLVFHAIRSRINHFFKTWQSEKKLNTDETFIALQINKI